MRTTKRRSRALAVGMMGALVAVSLATTGAPVRAATPQLPQIGPNSQYQAPAVDTAAFKPESPRLDSRLEQLAEIERRDGAAAARQFAAANAIPLDLQGRAQVLIHESVAAEYENAAAGTAGPEQRIGRTNYGEEALFELLEVPIRERVARLGGNVRGRVANLIDASLPIGNLRQLDDAFGVGWVEAAPVARRSVVSEGVNVIQASALQSSSVAYQPTDPIRVGVVDIGFKGYESLLGSELPSSVTAMSFHPGGIEGNGDALFDQLHGTACAEIIFDVVPQVELYLANFDSLSDNDDAIDWMIEQNVDVISYSIGWFNAGPGDGRGPVNQAVDRALDAGIEFVVAAGNDARTHWQGQYSDPDNDGWHNFAPNDESNAVFLDAGDELVAFLNWDDWFSSAQDYDLFIEDADGNVVAFSASPQTGTQNPAEAAGFTAPTSGVYHVLINRWSATRDVTLELFFFVDREMQYITPASSITIPADSEGAVSVGATYWGNDVIEAFSSLGPTNDGRIKPDLTAPDGVSTVTYGNYAIPFYGTSASAPHTAGAIALMKARFGVFSLEEIREILYGRAIDKGIAGKDNTYGFGRLDVIGR